VRTAVHAALSLIDPRPNVYGPGIHRRPCPLSNGALTIRTMSCSCTYCSLDLAWGSSVTRRPSFVMYPNAGNCWRCVLCQFLANWLVDDAGGQRRAGNVAPQLLQRLAVVGVAAYGNMQAEASYVRVYAPMSK